jgi:succinate dehydrogenase hydrophobic anchor subunit
MSALTSAFNNFKEGLLYRGREGHLLFIGHRLAGLGTLLFLVIHIVDTSFAYFGPVLEPIAKALLRLEGNLYNHAIEVYRTPLFMVGEILLVAAVLFHGVNGLHIILKDTFPHWWTKKAEPNAFWRIASLTFLLWIGPAYLMGKSLYEHSICRCPSEAAIDVAARTNMSLIAIPILFFGVLAVLAVGASVNAPSVKRTVAAPPKTLETYGWLFMRWSGVLLIPLAWGHVLLQDVLVGVHAIDINYVAQRWGVWGWQVYDIALLGFAFGHGMNGLRGIAEDYIHHPGWLKAVKFLIFWGWVMITAIGAVAIMGGARQ